MAAAVRDDGHLDFQAGSSALCRFVSDWESKSSPASRATRRWNLVRQPGVRPISELLPGVRDELAPLLGGSLQADSGYRWVAAGSESVAEHAATFGAGANLRLCAGGELVCLADTAPGTAGAEVRGVLLAQPPASPFDTLAAKVGVSDDNNAGLAELDQDSRLRFAALDHALQRTRAAFAEPSWYLKMLAVSPRFQKQGVGSRLLNSLLALADLDAVRTYLECSRSNEAYFSRFGFVVHETTTPTCGTDVGPEASPPPPAPLPRAFA